MNKGCYIFIRDICILVKLHSARLNFFLKSNWLQESIQQGLAASRCLNESTLQNLIENLQNVTKAKLQNTRM